MVRIAAVVSVLLALLAPHAKAADAPGVGEHVPGQPYIHREATDALGRTITYYLSDPGGGSDGPLPLVVYVQGSGCNSHFAERGGRIGSATGHSLIERVASGRARTLIVEKPGVAYLDMPANPGSAEGSTEEFRREHTLDRWATAILGAIEDAWALEGIDASRTMVIGHSEGGIVAARVAALDPRVTHVGVFAGEGATQLYSLIRLARAGRFGGERSTPESRVAYIVEGYERVLETPDAHDAFFLGHPHRRWSTFCATSPAEQLRRTDASVLIAQGLEDHAVEPSSAEILYAELLALGRDAELMLIPDGDHSLNIVRDGEIIGSAFQTATERAMERFESNAAGG